MREDSLNRILYNISGGKSGIKEYTVPQINPNYDEAVQVTLGKKLAIHLVNIWWRSTAVNDDITIFFDARNDEAGAALSNSGVILVCKELYPGWTEPGLSMFYPVPIIGSINQSIYVGTNESADAAKPRVFIWYSEIDDI